MKTRDKGISPGLGSEGGTQQGEKEDGMGRKEEDREKEKSKDLEEWMGRWVVLTRGDARTRSRHIIVDLGKRGVFILSTGFSLVSFSGPANYTS